MKGHDDGQDKLYCIISIYWIIIEYTRGCRAMTWQVTIKLPHTVITRGNVPPYSPEYIKVNYRFAQKIKLSRHILKYIFIGSPRPMPKVWHSKINLQIAQLLFLKFIPTHFRIGCVFYLCLCLSHGFKTESKPWQMLHFWPNVTFSVPNAMFFSGRDYVFHCRTVLITWPWSQKLPHS